MGKLYENLSASEAIPINIGKYILRGVRDTAWLTIDIDGL